MAGSTRWAPLLAYGALNFPLATIGLPMAIYLAPFYAGELQLPLAALGLAMVVAKLANFVFDPLIGTLSDRWRPRMGRRRVWVPIGVPTLAIGVWLLFNPPAGAGLVYLFAALALTTVGFTMTQLPWMAWGSELSNDYEGRTRIASIRQPFNLAGLIFATAIPAVVLGRPGATAADVLHAMSIGMIAALIPCALLLLFVVPEPVVTIPHVRIDFKRSWRQLRRNGPFLRIMTVLLFGFTAETFRQTITLFFARDVIGVPNFGVIYVLYFATGLALLPFWMWLGNRIGKHRAFIVAFGVIVTTNLGLFLLHRGQIVAFTVMFMLKGSCFGALELLPAAMAADVADVDTVMSRQRRQGLLFAIYGMVVTVGIAAGQGLSLNLLALIGFKAAGGNGPDTMLAFRMLYCLVPTALMAVPIWALLRYPLTAARHRRFQAYLEARDASGTDGGAVVLAA